MFGIGLPELILILALALIVVGPDKLPDMAKSIAKQLLELKKTANTLKDSLQEELKDEDLKRSWEELDPLSDEAVALKESPGYGEITQVNVSDKGDGAGVSSGDVPESDEIEGNDVGAVAGVKGDAGVETKS